MNRLALLFVLSVVCSRADDAAKAWRACFVLVAETHRAESNLDTQRIQNALNLCSPGMAVVLKGDANASSFYSAPLLLRRGVTLLLDHATLFASKNPRDYDLGGARCDLASQGRTPTCKPFIFSYQAADSGVAGAGTIDGRGCPEVIADYESQGFHISDVTVKNGAGALIDIEKTIDASIERVTFDNSPELRKGAAIVLRNVVQGRIENSTVKVSGAAISVRPSILGPTSKLALRNIAVLAGSVETSDAQDVASENVRLDASAQTVLARPSATIDTTSLAHFGAARSVVVAQDGSGDFTMVQPAIDTLPQDGGEILIKPGTYREVVTLRKPHVHIHGNPSGDPAKTLIVFNNAGPTHGGTFNSSTFFVEADDATLDHFTVANDAGPQAGQAVALLVNGDRAVFRDMRFLGAQDTLYAASKHCYSDYGPCVPARQYFVDSYIEGGVDFIFGDAKAVFERCELHGIASGNVMFTAQSKHTPDQASGYVFKHCKLTAAERSPGNIALGRAWRPYATVVFLNAEIDAPVLPAGWIDWPRFGVSTLPTAFFAEYHSQGPGANPQGREPYSHQLTAQQAAKWETPAFLAGSDGWDPANEITRLNH